MNLSTWMSQTGQNIHSGSRVYLNFKHVELVCRTQPDSQLKVVFIFVPGYCIFFLLQNITHCTSQLFLSTLLWLMLVCMYFSESRTLLLWCPFMVHLTEWVILTWHMNFKKLELDFDDHRFRKLILPRAKFHRWSDLGDWLSAPWLSADQWSVVTSVGLAPCVSWPLPVLITRDTGHYEPQAGSRHPAPHHWPGTRWSGPSYLTTRVHRGLSLRRLLITNWSRYTGQGRPALSRQLDHFTRENMMF